MKALVTAVLAALVATTAGPSDEIDRTAFTVLDRDAQPFRGQFNADAGKIRLVMYVSPTCGGCLRGADQSQKQILERIDSDDLSVYVVWVPRNGAREEHVARVTNLVTDSRAAHYWDEHAAVADPVDEMLELSGPCAGTFMLYDRDATWGSGVSPEPMYWEDAHARELNRDGAPQFDADGFADRVRAALEGGTDP